MTTSPTTGFQTRYFFNADNSCAGAYQGPDGEDNPHNGLSFTYVPYTSGKDTWNPGTNSWIPYTPPDPPIVQIQKSVQQLQDRTSYNFGTMAYINTCMAANQWALALEALNTITPSAQDQTTYNAIKSVMQAQIGGT